MKVSSYIGYILCFKYEFYYSKIVFKLIFTRKLQKLPADVRNVSVCGNKEY